jgi:endonuclease-3
VAARIGLSQNAKTPLATEKQLLKYIPSGLVHKFHHWIILHGRYICVARTPKCGECGLKPVCKYYHKYVVPKGIVEPVEKSGRKIKKRLLK